MLSVKQSSPVGPEIRSSGSSTMYTDGDELAVCGHDGLKAVASILATGYLVLGGRNRREAIGGSAYGIPRN